MFVLTESDALILILSAAQHRARSAASSTTTPTTTPPATPAGQGRPASTSTKRACALLGASRATLYRRRNPPQRPTPGARPAPPNKLTEAERQHILTVLRSPEYCDLSPAQVWARLLDDGIYLCSIRTMYRLLAIAGENRERRRQRTHPARKKPELIATAPNQVWSWDITKLQGPQRGIYYQLYVIIDIYSRYVVGWTVAATETSELAREFIADTTARHGIERDQLALHADRGTSMTSKPVAQLLIDLGVDRSHSRPHVSNDNPYSEANFKTLKYCPAFPGRFGSIEDARAFCTVFFDYYNHVHRFLGLACTRPRRCTTAPPPRSRPNARRHSTPPTPPTRPGSDTNDPPHRNCPPSPGSTNPHPKRSSNPSKKLSHRP